MGRTHTNIDCLTPLEMQLNFMARMRSLPVHVIPTYGRPRIAKLRNLTLETSLVDVLTMLCNRPTLTENRVKHGLPRLSPGTDHNV